MVASRLLSAVAFASLALATPCKQDPAAPPVTCNGKKYQYDSLAGFGSLPHDARDEFGDTISIGSAMAVTNWHKAGDKYKGTVYGLPDRGWNTKGTTNTAPRVHILEVTFTPKPHATVAKPSPPNVEFKYKRSILLKGPDGQLLTGLDPDFTGGLTYPGFPVLPAATYPGDGFGGSGPGGKRISLDAEGLFLDSDGGFWISDEYGPFVYKFDKSGQMVAAIQPPDAILPVRSKQVNFNSNTPPIYDPDASPEPEDPEHGRQNNQGFEGLTVSPDGKDLWVLLQSAAMQDGGASSSKRRMTRLLQYSITPGANKQPKIEYLAQYVVPLPTYQRADGATRVAAQSEVHWVSDTQFFILARDSSGGRGQDDPTSRYRHIDVVDISGATNIKGPTFDDIQNGNITVGGIEKPSVTLVAGITPAVVCPFIDYNLNAQLNKFTAQDGSVVHNGAPVDLGLLNEKWEALAVLPVNELKDGRDVKDQYYVFTLSDNDFVSNDGYANFGQIPFVDDTASVPFLDSQALVFRVTLPQGTRPLIGQSVAK
ncbi:hypothetical protein N656DRAFT_786459 [Canariomyces notabilis]|uniref:Phytase-like domain-containing protein n=1 Tax=Canariomyces notabilis TaxID=2074819 RepID=A0AAN6TNT4_9PEZI|nr:hypothetical protein N656DRAFT_786459 [Canariomyces arenarius]